MKTRALTTATVVSLLLLPGCQNTSATLSPETEKRIATLEQRVAKLEKSQASKPPSDGQSPVATETKNSQESAGKPENQTPEPLEILTLAPLVGRVDFSSYPSPERLKEIVSFGFLPRTGITEPAHLDGDITRGQYVAMLVEMNNFIFNKDSKQIRLPRSGEQAFEDVPPSHPHYKYIQGMMNAGYVIGFNESSFQPDKVLSREEMLAIAAKRDYRLKPEKAEWHWQQYAKWTDKEEIAPKYRHALAYDAHKHQSNVKQAFGDSKLLHPKQNVKAYEAILSLYGVGNHSGYSYTKKVKASLGK